MKSHNYHANYTSGGAKTPVNRGQNFSIKYQVVKKSQHNSRSKRLGEYNSSKSTQRLEQKTKKGAKSISSYSTKSISVPKSKQKLSREKIKFKNNNLKIGKNFYQSKPLIGKMIPPKTQREMESFFNTSSDITRNEGYACDLSNIVNNKNSLKMLHQKNIETELRESKTPRDNVPKLNAWEPVKEKTVHQVNDMVTGEEEHNESHVRPSFDKAMYMKNN